MFSQSLKESVRGRLRHLIEYTWQAFYRWPFWNSSGSGGSRIFCLGGANGSGIFVWGANGIKRRRRETAIAEGKKPLTTRGLGERRKPPVGYGAEPQKPTQFWTFQAKMEYIFGSC